MDHVADGSEVLVEDTGWGPWRLRGEVARLAAAEAQARRMWALVATDQDDEDEGSAVGAVSLDGPDEPPAPTTNVRWAVPPHILERQDLNFYGHDFPSSAHFAYTGPTAGAAAGVTYRQLDYWLRTGLLEPSVRVGKEGVDRLYSVRDIVLLRAIKRLLDTGVSLHMIRSPLEHLRSLGLGDLAQVTLMSDGESVYECTSADEVIDLVQSGRGVFGIAVGRVYREVESKLSELTFTSADPREVVEEPARDPRRTAI